jgi:N utilization substance protein B
MTENKPVVTSLVVGDEASVSEAPSSVNQKSTPRSGAKKNGSQSRRKSRELVLKAVYRGMLNESELSDILRDMRDDPDYNKADEAYFKHLLQTVTENLAAIDSKIVEFIDRSINELSPVEHAILRISGCELMFDLSIPYRVVINEGVELAKVFGGIDGHKYINGVLDKFAADVREVEVSAARS